MKRSILMSLLVIGAVVAVIAGATTAYFSDSDTSGTSTYSAGIIDITLEDSAAWEAGYTLEGLKPSETGWIRFRVINDGPNDVVIWKRLEVTRQWDNVHPESEDAEDSGGTINNLASWMLYDLYVRGKAVIHEDQLVRVDNIDKVWIELGKVASGGSMLVEQSYHLRPETTNWAQGDAMDFTIELLGTQTNDPSGPIPAEGELDLVAKDDFWSPVEANGAGTVEYEYTSSSPGSLDASFDGTVPLADTDYSMIYYPDPWPGSPGCVFNTGHSDAGGTISIAEGTCAVPDANDQNQPAGIKIWLVPSADYDVDHMKYWHPENYLFETHLLPLP